jgi:hypothetical protein
MQKPPFISLDFCSTYFLPLGWIPLAPPRRWCRRIIQIVLVLDTVSKANESQREGKGKSFRSLFRVAQWRGQNYGKSHFRRRMKLEQE